MVNLCKYKDLLGKPNEGIHSYRIFNIAIADLLMTVLFALFLSYILKYSFIIILIILLLLGIILHRVFCVHTTVDDFLFSL
jgi:hypothetical protein